MGTRGAGSIPYSRQTIFDELVKCCESSKIKFDRTDYGLDLKFMLGIKYHIVLKEEQGTTVLQVLSAHNTVSHRKLIENLLIEVARSMNFELNLKLEEGEYKEIKPISSEENLKRACNACSKHAYSFELRTESLCPQCFESKYGKLLLKAEDADYYGGHKAYLAGGVFSNEENGKMYLTDKYFLFIKKNKDLNKSWEIIISLTSVLTEKWGIEEQIRRRQFAGGGTAITGNFAIGSGIIRESGKEHHLVVAYVDENGISHAPRFGVSSFRGKAIREWAAKLYDAVVEAKRKTVQNVSRLPNNEAQNISGNSDNNYLHVLKMRLVKGEISKEEYEELRKLMEL